MPQKKKTCFVVMGFNKKKDPVTGRVLDLDKTYRGIIKPAVQAAGFECIRADEIQHAGVIDIPMYDWLLRADLVVADLSTLNPNAFFELGVRYALKPRTTIVIAESEFKNPFDTNHIATRSYRHDGEALDFEVVEKFGKELAEAIRVIDASGKVDSPVYAMLHGLKPPVIQRKQKMAEEGAHAAATARAEAADTQAARDALDRPMAELMERALGLRAKGEFKAMADLLTGVRAIQGPHVDDFVVQQLALATYKSERPTPTEALLEARDILTALDPRHSLDAETIGLWGAVYKRLASAAGRSKKDRKVDLDEAIDALDRGFRLLRDYYNGINAAFLYDLRAHRTSGENAQADRVIARRIRTEVLRITEELGKAPPAGETEEDRAHRAFWIKATHAEALFGLGRRGEATKRLDAAAGGAAIEPWMLQTARKQLADLEQILS